jgi:hypothetical protein
MSEGTRRDEHIEYVRLLKSIFKFLLVSGAERGEVKGIVAHALEEVLSGSTREAPLIDFGLATAGRVLDAWHRRRPYITENAEPRAIPLLGRAPSVQALVKLENPRCDSEKFARRLRSLGLLRRSQNTLFKPVMPIAVVTGLNPLIQEHVARSSAMLLQTINQNVTTPPRQPRLIERFAEVPDLPVEYAEEFRRFSQEQGWAMLKTLNDWLESRRGRRVIRRRTRTVRAGVHLYAYVGAANSKTP